MSKVLLINGSPNEYGCTYTALKEVADTLSKNDVKSEILYLGKKPIAGCIACGKCSRTGRCIFDDKVNTVLESWTSMTVLLSAHRFIMPALRGNSVHFLIDCFSVVKTEWLAS